MLTLPLQRVLTAVDYCVLVELAYCWYALWRLRKKTEVSVGLGTNDRIGHMVNSDTNVKYTIVHNISFILLFVVFFSLEGHLIVRNCVRCNWGIPFFLMHRAVRSGDLGSSNALGVLAY